MKIGIVFHRVRERGEPLTGSKDKVPDSGALVTGNDFRSKISKIVMDNKVEKVKKDRIEAKNRRKEEYRRDQEELARKERKEGLDRYVKYKSKAIMFLSAMEQVKEVLEKHGLECMIESEPDFKELQTRFWEDKGRYTEDSMKLELTLEIPFKGKDGVERKRFYGFEFLRKPILTSYSRVRSYEWHIIIFKKSKNRGTRSKKEIEYDQITKEFIENDISKWLKKTLRSRADSRR